MNDNQVVKLMDEISKLIDKKINDKLSSVLLVSPATITQVSVDKLSANIRIIGDDEILNNIPIYNNRTLNVGDSCYVGYWGKDGKRMNNIVVLFGG